MVHGTCRWCRRTFWQFDALNELGVTEEDPEFLRASGRRFWMILEWLHHFASVFSVVLRNHHFLRLFFLKWMTVREWLLEPTNLRRPQHRKCEIFFEFWNSGGTKWWHSFFLRESVIQVWRMESQEFDRCWDVVLIMFIIFLSKSHGYAL